MAQKGGQNGSDRTREQVRKLKRWGWERTKKRDAGTRVFRGENWVCGVVVVIFGFLSEEDADEGVVESVW